MVDLLFVLAGLLFFALALCLSMSLAVLRQIRLQTQPVPEMQAGMSLPPLQWRPLHGPAAPGLPAQAHVLLFLISGCPKCKSKLAQIQQLLPLARQAGVEMLLISMESRWRLRRFLQHTTLLPQVRRLSRKQYLQLNPQQRSPMYFFVNHHGVLDASGMPDDANWQAFCAQLQEVQAQELAA